MDKSVINALVANITKEELEKKTSQIRANVAKEVESFLKSKSAKNLIKKEVEEGLAHFIEEGFCEYLDSRTIRRIVQKTVNKIVGA